MDIVEKGIQEEYKKNLGIKQNLFAGLTSSEKAKCIFLKLIQTCVLKTKLKIF